MIAVTTPLASLAQPGGILKTVAIRPEGRLLAIALTASAPMQSYTLMRQGPPQSRDLVLSLPGFTSETPAAVDTGDHRMRIEIARDEKTTPPGLRITFGGVGDSLVKVVHEGAALVIVIIPPEKGQDAADAYLMGANDTQVENSGREDPKGSDAADAYRIGADDTLQIDVFGHDDLNKTLKVSPHGLISFPLIGKLRAEGRTVDDLADEITQRLSANYIQDPHVTVSIWEYLSQWVSVMGEVAQPGRYYMTGPMSLIDALSQAGGLTEKAGKEIVVTRRREAMNPASAGEVFRVEVSALLSALEGGSNLRLQSGDVVNISPAGPDRAAKP